MLAMFIGMILYYKLFSKLLVEGISFLLLKIKRIISKVIRKIVKRLKKVAYIQKKRLKYKVKSSKMSLSDFGEGDLLEEKEK